MRAVSDDCYVVVSIAFDHTAESIILEKKKEFFQYPPHVLVKMQLLVSYKYRFILLCGRRPNAVDHCTFSALRHVYIYTLCSKIKSRAWRIIVIYKYCAWCRRSFLNLVNCYIIIVSKMWWTGSVQTKMIGDEMLLLISYSSHYLIFF